MPKGPLSLFYYLYSIIFILYSDMKGLKEKILWLYNFVVHDIWRITGAEVSRTRRFFYACIKTLVLAIRGFFQDKLQTKASALTYSTLFALVPVLALIFAIGKGFGFQELIINELNKNLAGQQEVLNYLLGFVDKYLTRAKGGVFVGVGIAMLFWSVMSAFKQIEGAFNDIWQVKKSRSFVSRFTTYMSLMIIVPVFIIASSGISVFMNTQLPAFLGVSLHSPISIFFMRFLPFFVNWILFTCIFIVIPNIKVKLVPAIVAGIFSGTFFQLFQYLYIKGQVYLSSYNAVYGSFAIIPLLLMWLQFSWIIVLLGAELSYVVQNISKFEYDADTQKISRRYHDFVLLVVMYLVVKRFENGEEPITGEEISQQNSIPIRLVTTILNQLSEINLINEVYTEKTEQKAYQPAIDINKITVSYLFEHVEEFGSEEFKMDKNPKFMPLWNTLTQLHQNAKMNGGEVLVKDLQG